MKNILEINEMIDLLEDFINDSLQTNIVVGGMIGTQIFKYVVDEVMAVYPFENILIIEGCQDYIGITKPSPCKNHFFYADLFHDNLVNSFKGSVFDTFRIINDSYEYGKILNEEMINVFPIMIVADAHLIPKEYMNAILKSYTGKIIMVVDPFDINGDLFTGCPTITDTLAKVSTIIAMARETYGVESRALDKKVRCNINQLKIRNNQIGRIDDKQYVTDNRELAETIWAKQIEAPIKKGMKVMVASSKMNMRKCSDRELHAFNNRSMLVVDSVLSSYMRLRMYHSKITFDGLLSYDENPPTGTLAVQPANILMIDETPYHRYTNIVLLCDNMISPRQKYSILKNSQNVTVAI